MDRLASLASAARRRKFLDNCFLKIGISRKMPLAMNDVFDNYNTFTLTAEKAADIRAHIYNVVCVVLWRRLGPKKKKVPGGSAQPIEKVQNGQENGDIILDVAREME
jgi:hypothetical protein